MAKKVRTPPPPRRVQAPQRRETRRPGTSQPPPWLYAAAGALVAAAIAAAVVGIVVSRGGGSATTKTTATNYNTLPGIRKTKAPWPPEYLYLADRLPSLGLTTLGQEGVATHIHAHLDIFVNGKRVTVPPQIGINPAQCSYTLTQSAHTGVMQVGMGDGSVRGVSAGVSATTWSYVQTPSDGQPLGSDW